VAVGVSLEKLLSFSGNKYIFSKATMKAIEKISNLKNAEKEIPETDKIVIKVLNLMLEDKIKFVYNKPEEEKK